MEVSVGARVSFEQVTPRIETSDKGTLNLHVQRHDKIRENVPELGGFREGR